MIRFLIGTYVELSLKGFIFQLPFENSAEEDGWNKTCSRSYQETVSVDAQMSLNDESFSLIHST